MPWYVPAHYRRNDPDEQLRFAQSHNFATLVTVVGDENPWVSHLPLLISKDNEGQFKISGHCARSNLHWKALAEGRPTWIYFRGPHSYISPSWYPDPTDVPTWNYTALHMRGIPRTIEDATAVDADLAKLVEQHERDREEPWQYSLPEDFKQGLIRGIIGFEIKIDHIEAKFKLGQNRNAEDREGAIRGLRSLGTDSANAVAQLMSESLKINLKNKT